MSSMSKTALLVENLQSARAGASGLPYVRLHTSLQSFYPQQDNHIALPHSLGNTKVQKHLRNDLHA